MSCFATIGDRHPVLAGIAATRVKACAEKARYETLAAAQAAVDRLVALKRHRPEQGPLLAYPCPYDRRHFHIGHKVTAEPR